MTKQKPTLNQADVNLLKKTFLTKSDAKNFLTKDDAKNFASKDDLKNFATKDEIKKIIKDEFHESFSEHYDGMIKPEFEKIDKRFNSLEIKVDNHYRWLKDDINGLKADLSNTVSKREFHQLKARVEKYHPAS